MTSYGNDNKYDMINTHVDATNRVDQDISAPFLFSIDEFVDTTNQKAPFSITTHSAEFGGEVLGRDDDTLHGHYVDFLGNKIALQGLLDEMTLLTDTSLNNCKNDRKEVLDFARAKWQDGMLISEWTGKLIPSDDEEGFTEYCKAEVARLNAPILTATMIKLVKKLAKLKIAVIWHITGYPDAVRYFKNRLHHLNQVPDYILRHPRYESLFEGK